MMRKIYILIAMSTACFGMEIAGPSKISGRVLVELKIEEAMQNAYNALNFLASNDPSPQGQQECACSLTQHTLLLARCIEEGRMPSQQFFDACDKIVKNSSKALR